MPDASSFETTTARLLAELQSALQQRYDLELPYHVEDFVSHDAQSLSASTGCALHSPEMLLVREQGNNLDITLFLDPATVSEVCNVPWLSHWTGQHFNSYCTILEGISHFVYLSWSAHHDRPVRPAELELQAEVDKFVFAALNARADQNAASDARLLKRLFVDIEYRQDLSGEQRNRYQTANAAALNYCSWLCDNFKLAPDNNRLTAELARFYRTCGSAKFKHAAQQCTSEN